ncbi:hypothetical protein ACE38V_15700 [Cytobacillus sp. Hz8]|uniref:hypothetical protein n=1 Tax=Cytobacillus sp. Hz8 TaxID=3347168 RepID=UPI0035DC7808
MQYGELPLLDEIEEDLMKHLCDEHDEDEDGNEMEMFLKKFMEIDDETLRSMPHELQKQMLVLESQGILPGPIAARIRRLFK